MLANLYKSCANYGYNLDDSLHIEPLQGVFRKCGRTGLVKSPLPPIRANAMRSSLYCNDFRSMININTTPVDSYIKIVKLSYYLPPDEII